MNNQREEDRVLMNISNTSGAVMNAALFSTRMTFKLVSFLFRLAKKGMVALGAADKFKEFSNATGGKYTAYNIPLNEKHAKTMQELGELELELENTKNPLDKIRLRREIEAKSRSIPEIEQLNKLGIKYCVLPKLNGSDQTMQITVSKEDDQLFKTWFGNHLTGEMSLGGEKNLETIKVFTEGNYSILNMPFEEVEELAEMTSDFNTMGVNYSILPDLRVGDGYTQVAIPIANRGLVEQWFQMWKERAISNGEKPKDMYAMDEGTYMNTAAMTAEEYINGSEPEYQAVQKDYENNSVKVPFTMEPGKENSEEFIRFSQDARYEKITINKETLVENQVADKKEYAKEGLFASRVPGTYKENEKTLLVPMGQIFSTDNGKTYVAFLEKSASVMGIDQSTGKAISFTGQDVKAIYDKVERGFNKVEAMEKTKTPTLAKGAELVKGADLVTPKLDFNLKI